MILKLGYILLPQKDWNTCFGNHKMNTFNYSVSMSQFYHGIREESSDEFCDQTACERNILSYNFFFAKPQN